MRFIGRREGVPERLAEQMDWAEALTDANRTDHAVRRLQLRRARGDPRRRPALSAASGEEEFRRLLYAPDMHDPDLIIRTSGERGSPTTCSGRPPTPSSCSARSCGPTSRARRSSSPSPSSALGDGASVGAERQSLNRTRSIPLGILFY